VKKTYLLLLLLLLPLFVQGQIITTIAGGGTSNADGIPATNANIGDPQAMVHDKFGNIYYTDALGHRIRKISTTGIFTTIAGNGSHGYGGDNGPATLALVNDPVGITIDNNENIYFSDEGNHRIRRIDAVTHIITTIAGTGIGSFAGDGGPASNAMLNYPSTVQYHNGELFIADGSNRRIRKIDKAGIITTIAGAGIDKTSGDGGPATNAECRPGGDLAIDIAGNVFFVDAGQMIRKIDTKGIITTIAGNPASYAYNGDERPATSATLAAAVIAFNHSGELFISGGINNRVRKIDNNGYIHTVAGNGTGGFSGDGSDATKASIDGPCALLFDSCDNLLIANVNGARIRKVAFNPLCWRLAVKEEAQAVSMRVYPIPAAEELHVDNLISNTSYNIVSIAGQSVQQGHLHKGSNSVAISTLPPGMYLFITTDQHTGQRQVKKIIKE